MGETHSLRRIVLQYGRIAIGVAAHRATDLEWIADMMTPAFSVAESGTADVEVEFFVDAEKFGALERRGPEASGGSVAGVILDASTQRFARWSSEPESQAAFDPEFGVFFEVRPGPFVRLTGESGESCRVGLLRVVREFATESCLRAGDVFLHAASLCVDGRALVLAGRKRAGKTTCLSWSLALLGGARFIANDRVRMQSLGPHCDVRGMPTVVSLRPGSLALLPELAAGVRRLRGRPYQSRSEVRERADIGPLRPFVDGRLGLMPSRYAEVLGRSSVANAPAGALVFPEVADDDLGLRAVEIDASDAAERLAGAVFGVDRRSELFSLPAAGPYPSASDLRERMRRITDRVPGYVWRVGRAAPRDAEGLRRFVEQLPNP